MKLLALKNEIDYLLDAYGDIEITFIEDRINRYKEIEIVSNDNGKSIEAFLHGYQGHDKGSYR